MHFDLKIKAESDQLKFAKNSALVKFFIDSKRTNKLFENFFESLQLPLSETQKKQFLDKKVDELTYYTSSEDPSVLFIKKVKLDDEFNVDFYRNYFAGLIPTLVNKHLKVLHIILPVFKDYQNYFPGESYFIQTMIEGILLGNYTFNYKSEKEKEEKLNILFHHNDKKLLKGILDSTKKIMDSVYFARDLINEPAISLLPMNLAFKAKNELTKYGVDVTILDKKELEKRNMNAILAVGGASDKPPCMIIMHYKPQMDSKKKIALVGKGVTYDSGGLSIKPTSGMLEMKADMAGGAAVIGIIRTAALMELPIEIIGIVPAVENMIGGNSFKPGDVIKAASGKTIEVKDTDAEGRVILADALFYASQQKPDQIINFATLTGACVVALGEFIAGLFTKSDWLAESLTKSGQKTFERVWRLPFWNDFNSQIKSEIADVSNLGPRWGGAITAGKFLEHFVDKNITWAHLDIAGPAIKHEFNNYTKKFDTGFGIRLIVDYLLNEIK
jgi:leucyl aminopeptidase